VLLFSTTTENGAFGIYQENHCKKGAEEKYSNNRAEVDEKNNRDGSVYLENEILITGYRC
jgi:hypothetical protein